jgi:hypothetical protein
MSMTRDGDDQLMEVMGESVTNFQVLSFKITSARLLIMADPLAEHLQSKFLDRAGHMEPFRAFFEQAAAGLQLVQWQGNHVALAHPLSLPQW